MNSNLQQAVAHFTKGDLIKTQAFLSTALIEEPLNGEAWHLQGVLALNAQKASQAVDHLTRAATLKPEDVSIHTNLAVALTSSGRFQDAEHAVRKALLLNPQFPEAHYQMGVCLIGRGLRREAIPAFTEAVRLRPDWPPALEMLGDALFHTGEHEQAVACAKRALAIDPNRALCHRIVADGYMRWLRYDEAMEHYQIALKLAPTDGNIRGNRALLLTRLGRTAESIEEYRKTIALMPNATEIREGLSFALLASGQFNEGWPRYAGRLKSANSDFAIRKGALPATDPAQLAGQPVLAWLNQGIGDQIMFSSLIPDLIATGADLTIECDPRLIPLLRRSFPHIATRPSPPEGEQAPNDASNPDNDHFSYQLYVPDTARWFRKDFAAFPRHAGYLKADEDLTQTLRQSYVRQSKGGPLVGIAWRTAINTKVSAQKTLALADWGPLLRARNATFVKLQYGDLRQEVAEASQHLGVSIISDATIDPITDMDSFASQVAAMDLVITTSNATAHMAGSMNIPVWILTPHGYGAIWHWFENRDDSPWYPSARLFRQHDRGDWKPVLERVGAALADFIGAWRE